MSGHSPSGSGLTLEQQKERLREALRKKAKRPRAFPLSFAQERLWFLDQLAPGTPSYNMPAAVRVRGPLRVGTMLRCLGEIVRRHEVLRTTFATEGGRPVQVVAPQASPDMRLADLGGLRPAEREAELARRVADEARAPFDLATGPLMRVRLVRLEREDHALLVTMHHIVSDGWSMGIFVRELVALYAAYSRDEPSPLPEPKIQYVDFSHWQRGWLSGDVLREQLDYWRRKLQGAPVLALPTDRPRPAVRSFRGAVHRFVVSRDLALRVRELGNAHDITLFMTLLAVFQIQLARYSGQEDVVVGSPIANRNRADIEGLIGFFVNTLVLRGDLSGDPTFAELLGRIRETCLDAYAHQDLPYEKLVDELKLKRDLSRESLFQVVFTLQNLPLGDLDGPGGLSFRPIGGPAEIAKFDLTLAVEETADGLAATFEYNTDLFDAETMERFGRNYEALLGAIADRPDRRISELDFPAADERRLMLHDWNRTAAERGQERPVHRQFECHATERPDALAACGGGQEITYGQLNARANRLACHLRSAGVRAETRVGVVVGRSIELLVCVLGTLKAGGAYVPLDPSYPAERLQFMAEDAQAPLLITSRRWESALPEVQARVVHLDDEAAVIDELSDQDPSSSIPADQLAYVIYTSGSTGRPKGVEIPHRGLANLVAWHRDTYGVGPLDRTTQVAAPAFDAAVWEIWPCLATGASLLFPDEATRASPEALVAWLVARKVTLAFLPTPLAEAALAEKWPEGTSLRALLTGGDRLHRGADPSHPFRLINHYGPTENTVVTTCGDVETASEGERPPPIGRPIENCRVYLLGRRGEPVPVGAAGELHVAGASLARGYGHRPELTAEYFLPDPFSESPGGRMYRTGDLCRYLPDGQIEFLGRIDHQVKIRGFRIELGEIESVLAEDVDVREAAVLARDDTRGERRLVAYVVYGDERPTVGELRARLRERLPESMVPSVFVPLDSLPLTPNGKVDRQALPAPDGERPELNRDYVAPSTPAERELARIWAELLGLERVGVHDNFFDLGGDSMRAIQVVQAAKKAALPMTPQHAFQFQTVAQLAEALASARTTHVEQGAVVGVVPLTPIQRWFFEAVRPLHHFNQSLMLEIKLPLDPDKLRTAAGHVLAHHDVLRARYAPKEAGWVQEIAAPNPEESRRVVSRVDLASTPDDELSMAIESKSAEVQAGLDLADGPLMRIVHFDLGRDRPARLLWVIHHLAVDTVSWQVLVEDLLQAYGQLLRDTPVSLLDKTTSFRDWSERLLGYAAGPELREELEIWLAPARREIRPLPVDRSDGPNVVGASGVVKARLDASETARLRGAVRSLDSTLEEALLACVVRAFAGWTDDPVLLVDLEGHGREGLFDDVDLSRTVGWFTSKFPVLFEVVPGEPEGVVRSVRDRIRSIPRRGIGYGLLRYSGDPRVRGTLAGLTRPQVVFNYLGRVDRGVGGTPWVRHAAESAGPDLAADVARDHLFEISAVVADDELHARWVYATGRHDRATVERLAEAFVASLRAVAERCPEASDAHADSEAAPPRSAPAAAAMSPLVPLHRVPRAVGKSPFFCVHQTQGLALSYLPLARHLDPDRPFYGIQAIELYGSDDPSIHVEEMATRYVDAIRTVQPQGPYMIGGHSFGAYVAYEMAQRLREQGQEVGTLALMDVFAPGKRAFADGGPATDDVSRLMFYAETLERFYHGLELGIDENQVRTREPDDRLEYFMQRLRPALASARDRAGDAGQNASWGLGDLLLEGGVTLLRGTLNVHRGSAEAVRRYTPRPYEGRITLFRSAAGIPEIPDEIASDPLLGWGELGRGGVDLEMVPGDHQSIIAEPQVQELARSLRRRLDAADSSRSRASEE